MRTFFKRSGLGVGVVAVIFCAALSAACAGEAPADLPVPHPNEREVPFVELEVRASGRGFGEVRRLITSEAEYRAVLGGPPPENVDFRRDWVVFYAAGVMPTGGYSAHISRINVSEDRGLTIETRLVVPGPRCFVTQALTNPYIIARIPRFTNIRRVNFSHNDEVNDCAR